MEFLILSVTSWQKKITGSNLQHGIEDVLKTYDFKVMKIDFRFSGHLKTSYCKKKISRISPFSRISLFKLVTHHLEISLEHIK